MKTVLVVEDSITQREIIKVFLQENHLIVTVAIDGAEALEKIHEHCPD